MELNQTMSQIQCWNKLKQYIGQIRDDKARKLYYKTLLIKATESYGFDPEKAKVKPQKPSDGVLDDWEKELVEDIKKAEVFQVDTRKNKRVQTHKEALARAKLFIERGGSYKDIPEELQNDTIKSLYLEAMESILDEINEEIANMS